MPTEKKNPEKVTGTPQKTDERYTQRTSTENRDAHHTMPAKDNERRDAGRMDKDDDRRK